LRRGTASDGRARSAPVRESQRRRMWGIPEALVLAPSAMVIGSASGSRPGSPGSNAKPDRVELLQRSSTRSAYSLTSPRLTVVAVHLVCRLALQTPHHTVCCPEGKFF